MKSKSSNDVTLRDVPTKLVRNALGYMHAEVLACDDEDICSGERPAYVALFNACKRELQRRRKRVPYELPAPPVSEGTPKRSPW